MPGCGNAGYPGGGDAGRVVLGRAGVVRRGLGLRRVARVPPLPEPPLPEPPFPDSLPFGRAFGGGAG